MTNHGQENVIKKIKSNQACGNNPSLNRREEEEVKLKDKEKAKDLCLHCHKC